ncbi:hypothetical protein, partial [Mesorhizobium sp. M1393]|uniref:hypothetical protein n=1 Tax=Mesorhizobium sp. M1393 TaxID=2957094 RepID=UPI00333CD263
MRDLGQVLHHAEPEHPPFEPVNRVCGTLRMSAALLMPREPVHGCVCFGQRLLDFLSRGVSALDVPDHLLPQPSEPCGAIYVAVFRSFKVKGR